MTEKHRSPASLPPLPDRFGSEQSDFNCGGTLWYYQGSGDPGAPFAGRTQVGGGWQMFDLLV